MDQDFRIRRPDLILGLALVGVGVGAAALSVNYDIGHLNDIGAGFFPLIVAACLILCGLLIGLFSFSSPETTLVLPKNGVRAILAIFCAIFAFSMTIEPLGLVPAIVLTVIISAFGSHEVVGKHLLIVAIVLPIICYLTFIMGLDLHVPAFQLGR
ncbi:tripartite tricarboxylate transporter TctB family protein [Roseibium algae]|uniref:Tripartite tricarboxylate transporter TctB family protein n=1 Tax=Roseibium algae TaxID=3123038 RepID=A0ABU8TRM5_9HYPH